MDGYRLTFKRFILVLRVYRWLKILTNEFFTYRPFSLRYFLANTIGVEIKFFRIFPFNFARFTRTTEMQINWKIVKLEERFVSLDFG